MEPTKISKNDPRYAAATRVLEAMHDYFKLQPCGGAVRWIQDDRGRVIIFTRGEYRDALMSAVKDCPQRTEFFQLEPSAQEG
jgi:hypothetical protein